MTTWTTTARPWVAGAVALMLAVASHGSLIAQSEPRPVKPTYDDGNVEVVTGVNLPMVIKLASQSGEVSLIETARRVCDVGRQGIYLAGDLLAPPAKGQK